MSEHRMHGSETRHRPAGRRDMRRISPLPPPEEVFVDWLMSVPHGDSLEAAARCQIELIDSSPASSHPDVLHLRLLLVAIAGDGVRDVFDRHP